MAAVGFSSFGHRLVQLWCEWQLAQPLSPDTAFSRSRLSPSRASLSRVQARLSAAGPEIIRVHRHRIAGGVADGAVDAFDAGIPPRPARAFAAKFPASARRAFAVGAKAPPASVHFSKNGAMSAARSPDDRQVAQWRDAQAAAGRGLPHKGPAGPARLAVYRHGAGAAHADPAGEAVGQRRLGILLNPGHDIEDRLAPPARHLVSDIAAAACIAAPDLDRQAVCIRFHAAIFIDVACRQFIENVVLAEFGGAEGSRTPDLLNAIQALSQLSYGPHPAGRPARVPFGGRAFRGGPPARPAFNKGSGPSESRRESSRRPMRRNGRTRGYGPVRRRPRP